MGLSAPRRRISGVNPKDLDFTGNFNYGATGYAAGFPFSMLLASGAGTPKGGGHGPEPNGKGTRGFYGLGGTWPFGEKLTDANIEHDGYVYAAWLINFDIDLCAKKLSRSC